MRLHGLTFPSVAHDHATTHEVVRVSGRVLSKVMDVSAPNVPSPGLLSFSDGSVGGDGSVFHTDTLVPVDVSLQFIYLAFNSMCWDSVQACDVRIW